MSDVVLKINLFCCCLFTFNSLYMFHMKTLSSELKGNGSCLVHCKICM